MCVTDRFFPAPHPPLTFLRTTRHAVRCGVLVHLSRQAWSPQRLHLVACLHLRGGAGLSVCPILLLVVALPCDRGLRRRWLSSSNNGTHLGVLTNQSPGGCNVSPKRPFLGSWPHNRVFARIISQQRSRTRVSERMHGILAPWFAALDSFKPINRCLRHPTVTVVAPAPSGEPCDLPHKGHHCTGAIP